MGLITNVWDSSVNLMDTLLNLVTGLGTGKDPRSYTQVVFSELDRYALESMYRSNWFARRIVDLPAQDATREWRKWSASGADLERIMWIETHLSIQKKVRQAITKARLYGGGALIIGIDQGAPDEELDLDSVGKDDLKFVIVCNRWELAPGPRIYDVSSPYYTRPSYYTVATPTTGIDGRTVPPKSYASMLDPGRTMGSDSMVRIHPSRVIEFAGNELPDWRLAPMGASGWGDSVLQTADDQLRNFGMIEGGIATLINDMKMDVVKVPELTKSLSNKERSDKLLNRFAVANLSKSTLNTLMLDKEEEWQRLSTSFGSTPDLIRVAMTLVCAAGGVPESRIMGSAPNKGLSGAGGSGGEVDIRNYYDDVASNQRTQYKPALYTLDRCIMQSALGKFDPHVDYEWVPLYQPTPAEKATVNLNKAQATQIYAGMGLFNEDMLRESIVSQLTEDNIYPGLQAAIDDYGLAPEETEEPELDTMSAPPGGGGAKFEANPQRVLSEQAKIAAANRNSPAPSPASGVRDRFLSDFDPNEPRDPHGEWTSGGSGGGGSFGEDLAALAHNHPEEFKAMVAKLASAVGKPKEGGGWIAPQGAGEGGEGGEGGGEKKAETQAERRAKTAKEAGENWAAIIRGAKAVFTGKVIDPDKGIHVAIKGAVSKVADSTKGISVASGIEAAKDKFTDAATETLKETAKKAMGEGFGELSGQAIGAAVGTAVGHVLTPGIGGLIGAGVGAAAGQLAGVIVDKVSEKLGFEADVAIHLASVGHKAASAYMHSSVLPHLSDLEPALRQMAAYERMAPPMAGGGFTDSFADDAQVALEWINRVRAAVAFNDAVIAALDAKAAGRQ